MHLLSSSPLKGVRSNIRTLGMRLRADIPSQVRLLGCSVRVFYARQPRTCYPCGLLGHQAAGCSEPAVAPVNLFREEDFPPLPVEEDSVGVDAALAAAVPRVSPEASPADVAPPLEAVSPVAVASSQAVVSPSGVRPAPVAVLDASVVLPAPVCTAPPSSCSPSVPVTAPSPCAQGVLGAGVAVGPPTVPDLVPRVVEDAAVLWRASVRPACVVRVSGSTSGSDDVRPVPKRSRTSSDWADAGEFDEGGTSSDGGEVPSHSSVVAEVHVLAAASVDVSSREVPVELASDASPASDGSGSAWVVVPPAGERGDLVVVFKKTGRSGGFRAPSFVPWFIGSGFATPPVSDCLYCVSCSVGCGVAVSAAFVVFSCVSGGGAVSGACVRFFRVFCFPSLCLTSLCDNCRPAPGAAVSA
ncbi:calphotin-like [Procambarus clarkii]|uniref:calphotin-like n=1 Tax=Procambarus clarkii TaxID=6728 RepID=UPI0037445FE8